MARGTRTGAGQARRIVFAQGLRRLIALRPPRPPWRMDKWLAVPGVVCLIVAVTGQAVSWGGAQLGIVTSGGARATTLILGIGLVLLSFFVVVGDQASAGSAGSRNTGIPPLAAGGPSTASNTPTGTARPELSVLRSAPTPGFRSASSTIAPNQTESSPRDQRVPVRYALLEDLKRHQRQLDSYVRGYIPARNLTGACEGIRSHLEKPKDDNPELATREFWQELRHDLEAIDPSLIPAEFADQIAHFGDDLARVMRDVNDAVNAADRRAPAVRDALLTRVERMRKAMDDLAKQCSSGSLRSLDDVHNSLQEILSPIETPLTQAPSTRTSTAAPTTPIQPRQAEVNVRPKVVRQSREKAG